MAFQRDPLSARYDLAAGRLLGQAYAKPGAWVPTSVPRPRGGFDDAADSGGLTRWERAFQRALYWNNSGGGWSLQVRWGRSTARGRLASLRVTPAAAGYAAAGRQPAGEQWWRNPHLQSGGMGSVKQRFGT